VVNEIRRIDNEISGLENKEVLIEFSQEKIQDADIAQEAVNAAKSELKMSSAAQVLNKSISVNDALIQLTQNHFDGSILKRRLI
jgi:flagellin-like hook-associated protein FlgL